MKKLLLVRHAKAESTEYSDIERPLSEIGMKDAKIIGKFLKNNSISPDIIISSPALRAKQTAELISQEFSFQKESIIFDNSLYDIDAVSLINYISNLSNKFNSIILVGHNPTFAETLSIFLNKSSVNMPPAAVALLSSDAYSWCDFRKNCCLEFFINPKLVKIQS